MNVMVSFTFYIQFWVLTFMFFMFCKCATNALQQSCVGHKMSFWKSAWKAAVCTTTDIKFLARRQKSKRRVFHPSTNPLYSSFYSPPRQLQLGTASLERRVLMSAASLATPQVQFVLATFTKFRQCKNTPVSLVIGMIKWRPSTTHQLPRQPGQVSPSEK